MKSVILVGAALLLINAARAQQDASVGAPVVASPDKVQLRLKLVPGQKFKVTTELEFQTTTNTAKGPSLMRQRTTSTVLDVVTGVSPGGNIEMRHTFGETATSMEWKLGTGSWIKDRNSLAALEKEATQAMKDRSVDFKLSPRGRVIEVGGVENLVAALKKAAAASPAGDRSMLNAVAEGLGQSLSLKDKGVLQTTVQLPERAVAAGETWDNGPIVLQPVVANNTFARSTLVSRDNGLLRVNLAIELRDPQKKIDGGKQRLDAMRFTDQTGSGKGTIEIDEATGMTRRSDLMTYIVSKYPALIISPGKPPTINSALPKAVIYMRIHAKTLIELVAP